MSPRQACVVVAACGPRLNRAAAARDESARRSSARTLPRSWERAMPTRDRAHAVTSGERAIPTSDQRARGHVWRASHAHQRPARCAVRSRERATPVRDQRAPSRLASAPRRRARRQAWNARVGSRRGTRAPREARPDRTTRRARAVVPCRGPNSGDQLAGESSSSRSVLSASAVAASSAAGASLPLARAWARRWRRTS